MSPTSRRRYKKSKAKALQNHAEGVYGIRGLPRHEIHRRWDGIRRRRYGIKTEGGRGIHASRDAMRGRAAIPCNSHRELIPYQALRSWINEKTNRGSSFHFGGA